MHEAARNDVFDPHGDYWDGHADIGMENSGARLSAEDTAAYEAITARLSVAKMVPGAYDREEMVEMHLELRNLERRMQIHYGVDLTYVYLVHVTGEVFYAHPGYASGWSPKPVGRRATNG